jgi:hypothetical protein
MISEIEDHVRQKEELKKFITYAERAKTEKDLIVLCQKYLQHKDYYVEPMASVNLNLDHTTDWARMIRTPPAVIDTMCVSREVSQTDMLAAAAGNYGSYEHHIKADMARELSAELLHQGFIKFKSIENIGAEWNTYKRIIGTINVVKDTSK